MEAEAVIVEAQHAKEFKYKLARCNALDKRFRVKKLDGGFIAFPCIPGRLRASNNEADILKMPGYHRVTLTEFQPAVVRNPHEKLKQAVSTLIAAMQLDGLKDTMLSDLPTKWERHGDMVLFPDDCFRLAIWNSSNIWSIVASALDCKRLAQQSCVLRDGYRTPQVTLLHGAHGRVRHVDNHIVYSMDVTKCMFSSGNISEKLRVASFDCRDQVVVDFNAGIGYFTLPYLVHAGAAHVYAIEWNPDAVEALKMNLQLNKVEERCTVLEGDNINVFPCGVADRVNLGLIPCSRRAWPAASACINPSTGGVLHIHQNLTWAKQQQPPQARCLPLRLCEEDCSQNEATKSCGGSLCRVTNDDFETADAVDSYKVRSPRVKQCLVCSQGRDHGSTHAHWQWSAWAVRAADDIRLNLLTTHGATGWLATVDRIAHVKSYAPFVDHVVVDVRCAPIAKVT